LKSKLSKTVLPVQAASSIDDVEAINDFFNSPEIKNELHWFTYRDTLERAFERDDRKLYYVKEKSGTLIGALMVWCESRVLEEEEAQIRLVAVSKVARGAGIGRYLCEEAERFAQEYKKEQMIADVVDGSPAVGFWKSIGYEVQSEWETKKRTPMLTVEKPL
jgi:ribosomal protein S18 acetylase RimI-like enzyme